MNGRHVRRWAAMARWAGWSHNPLRRRSDRVESAVVARDRSSVDP